MDLTYSPEEIAFRDEVRAWLAENVDPDVAFRVRVNGPLRKEDFVDWHRRLQARGWLAQDWPAEYGGAEWTPVQQHIFEEEAAAANAPRIIPFGLKMLGPVLMKFGTPEQKAHYLPRILSGEDWWCQGYSEPGAGSDLASLKTRAVREGDHYIVNGQKTWTTLAQFANRIFCLVRTSTEGKPQEGISFLLIDMDSPGITVRPIHLLEGTHEVNEVFFDNVKVPVANLVGEENRGWTVAKYLLTHERTNIAGVGFSRAAVAHIRRAASLEQIRGRPLLEDPVFAARLAKVEMELDALATTNLRVLTAPDAAANMGPISSMLKIKGTEIRQELNDLARRAVGPHALPFASEMLEPGYNGPELVPDYALGVAKGYFNNRKITIYGGSNEVQRGIIAKTILGG